MALLHLRKIVRAKSPGYLRISTQNDLMQQCQSESAGAVVALPGSLFSPEESYVQAQPLEP